MKLINKINSINKKIKIQILISIIFGISLIFLSNIYVYGSENISINEVGYLEDNGNFILPVNDTESSNAINAYSEELENPKITISNSKTLLEYESDQDPTEYVQNNQEDLVYGYELLIDDKEKLYISDKELLDEAKDKIFAVLLPNKNEYNDYLKTGQYDDIIVGDKSIYKIELDNTFTVSKKYIPKDKVIDNSDDLIFNLFHKNYNTSKFKIKKYTVLPGESFEDILEKNDMTKSDFYINNPKYAGEPLLGEGNEIVVNEVEPMVKVAFYYEEQEEEVEEFDTIRKDDDDLAYGEEELDQAGKNGLSVVTYNKKMVNGEVTEKKIVKKESIKDPVSRIILEGTDEESGYGEGVYGDNTPSGDANLGGFIWPTDSRSISRGLSYGHNGTDIIGSYGDPEYAVADGTVVAAGWSAYGGGYEVQIDHGGGLYTVYSHMAQPPNVSAGQNVYQGQVVGYMGMTGNATGVHLHFEVRVGCSGDAWTGTPVEPWAYMS